MKDSSLLKLGGMGAILLGVVNALSSILYLILPPEQRAAVPAAQILPSVAQDATLLMLTFWLQALVGVLGLLVVPAFARLVEGANEGWLRWTSQLAVVGFAVSAVGYLLSVARLPGIAAAYVAGDAATKAALVPVWKSSIDLQGLWGYGAVGVWVFVLSLLAMRQAKLSRLWTYLGMVLGIAYWIIPAGTIFKSQSLLLVGVAIGTIITTLWYVWGGIIARSTA